MPEGNERDDDTKETGTSGEGQEPEGGNGNDEQENDDNLPEWAKRKITALNNENASWRTQLRDVQAKLKDAKTQEEVNEILEQAKQEQDSRIKGLEEDVLRERLARKYNLPDKLKARLTGSTPEEWEADAKELAELVSPQPSGRPSSSPRGGLSPNEDDPTDNLSPRELAQKFSRRGV